MSRISFQNLSFTYPEAKQPALRHIHFQVDPGEFVVLCGKSGCGKSTLLRQLKTALTPYGEREGEVLFNDTPLEEIDQRTQTERIGFVLQNPDNQIVTDKVWHELAYGLESLGLDNQTIRLRVAEMASFFGIQSWYHKSVLELSGGQKQMLNLAAIMSMQPDLLILDEPTSQLDPIAAGDFLATLKKINNEIGTTILLSEHRLEEALPLADRVLVMDKGSILADNTPGAVGQTLKQQNHEMLLAMPAPMRMYLALNHGSDVPVTVREGKEYIQSFAAELTDSPSTQAPSKNKRTGDPLIALQDVWFRYNKQSEDVVQDLSMQVQPGELYCIVGGNGTGKTTALNIVSGLLRPYRGKVEVAGRDVTRATHAQLFELGISVLPQDPQCLFLKNTIEEDLLEILAGSDWSEEEKKQAVEDIAQKTNISSLLPMHPYDVSGGEQQRAALAKVLLTEPKTLLLDEPTKGMDSFFKQQFAEILQTLLAEGVTILMVSHDIEFCAMYADRCALFFDGSIVTEGTPRSFFSGNSFYTTATNRMCRHINPTIITTEEAIHLCKPER